MFQVHRHFVALRVGGLAYMIMALANVNSQYVTLTASMNGPAPPNALSATDLSSTSITNPVASILSVPFQFANSLCSLASGLFNPAQASQNGGLDSVSSALNLGNTLLRQPQLQQQQLQQLQQQQLQQQQLQQQQLQQQQTPQPFIQQQTLPLQQQQQPTIQQQLQPQQLFIQQQPLFAQPQQQAAPLNQPALVPGQLL